jgi:DegV family protein with EDD domain
MQIRYLDGPRLRRALLAACEHARRQRAELNRINVFPVPDGDTGTNLALTVQAVADHLRKASDPEAHRVAQIAAEGAVLGARGNCGMMLSHFLLGFADSLDSHPRIGTSEFGVAMTAGFSRLYASLERPVEGTILTVMRDVAATASEWKGDDFVPLVGDLVSAARRSLATTPDLLPTLKKAGVVDAGAKGFVSLLEGVHLLLAGDLEAPEVESEAAALEEPPAERTEYPSAEEHFRFCTEALVRGPELPSQEIVREALRDVGDSLIVIRAAGVLKIHVHTDDPERVFGYLRELGTLVTHKAEDMHAQHAVVDRAAAHVQLARRPVSVVTDSACDLSEEIVRAHGIHVAPMTLIEGDRTYRDGIDITAGDFHERLRSQAALPTTSQPTPQAFLDTFSLAFEEGEAVVGVLVGSTLSGTLGSAEAAASRVKEGDVHLVDSRGASLLQGLLVLKAVELAELGRHPADIMREIERVRSRSGILFTVATLDRLIASGRVGGVQALVGRMLDLKPILGLKPDGTVASFGKTVGTERARVALLRALRRAIPASARKVRFGIVHVGVPALAARIEQELRAAYGADTEILTAPATPVIATHIGIGAWGVAYMVEDQPGGSQGSSASEPRRSLPATSTS